MAPIKASLEAPRAGRVTRHDSVEALIKHLDSEPRPQTAYWLRFCVLFRMVSA